MTQLSEHSACIMLAPNGARRTLSDHPAVPVTQSQIVDCVKEAADAGAHAVHLHVRDEQQQHILSAELYKDSILAIKRTMGSEYPVQITTEAVGRYSPQEQMAVVKDVRPQYTSVALSELAQDDSKLNDIADFYHWCLKENIGVQHILYSASDLSNFFELKSRSVIPATHNAVLFVLGRYTKNQISSPAMLDEFIAVAENWQALTSLHWMICAFGKNETDCLLYATEKGGHARVGFENNTLNEDGSVAQSNSERVEKVTAKINALPNVSARSKHIRSVLGLDL